MDLIVLVPELTVTRSAAQQFSPVFNLIPLRFIDDKTKKTLSEVYDTDIPVGDVWQ